MKLPTSDVVLDYVIHAGTGAFLGIFYSVLPLLVIEYFFRLLLDSKIGLLDYYAASPIVIGFCCCLGAYHVGKSK